MRIKEPAIVLDDRPYRFGTVAVRFMDGRGLIDLATGEDDTLRRLFAAFGVPPAQWDGLIDTFRDYVDRDDLVRSRGAERPEYRTAGQPGPANRPLATPREVSRISGWNQVDSLWTGKPRFIDVVSTFGSVAINPNTAPAAVLATLPDMNAAAIDRLLTARRQKVLDNVEKMAMVTGLPFRADPRRTIFFPASTIRLRLCMPESSSWRELAVRLTPAATATPWQIDSWLEMPDHHLNDCLRSDTASVFPDVPLLPAP